MTEPNPFESMPTAAVSPSPSEWPALPRQMAWVALVVGVTGIVITLIAWNRIDDFDYASLLRQSLSLWLSHLLMSALAAYWVTLAYLERNHLANYPQPAVLMLAYGVAWFLLAWTLGFALSHLYMWLYENLDYGGAGRLLNDCLWWLVDLLRFAVEALLTLWLVLHLFRHKARPAESPLQVSANALAWFFALGVVVISLQLNGLAARLSMGGMASEVFDGWSGLTGLVSAGLSVLVAFFAARSVLPAQVQGFRGGGLALACLITFALWFCSAVLGMTLVLAALWFDLMDGFVLMLLIGLLQLGLLWPFSRLGLRWGYRAQAA